MTHPIDEQHKTHMTMNNSSSSLLTVAKRTICGQYSDSAVKPVRVNSIIRDSDDMEYEPLFLRGVSILIYVHFFRLDTRA